MLLEETETIKRTKTSDEIDYYYIEKVKKTNYKSTT